MPCERGRERAVGVVPLLGLVAPIMIVRPLARPGADARPADPDR